MAGLNPSEIRKLANQYIGAPNGILGNFTYTTLADFFPECCNLEIDTSPMPGTMRARFISAIESACPGDQAAIIRAVLAKYPPNLAAYATRTQALHDFFADRAKRLDAASGVESPTPAITSKTVERAIGDAERLIRSSGATSGIDRIHTALHGYLRAVCRRDNIPHTQKATMAVLFNLLREKHPAFQNLGPRPQDIIQILRSMTSVMDVLNPIRNELSLAHANEILLEPEEAMLAINAARTILNYIDAKLASAATLSP